MRTTEDNRELRAALEVAKRSARDAEKEAVFVADEEATEAARAAYIALANALDALDKRTLD